MNSLPANSLENFAKTAEAVAATTKKLAKARCSASSFNNSTTAIWPAPRATLPANSLR